MAHARVPAYAKINLTLEVLWKRSDGYHDIATVFQAIDLCDWIEIEATPAPETRITVTSTVEIPGENIAARAARAVLEKLGAAAGVRIHIEKNIPLGGGLGGSSTDGSAVLMALPELLGRPLARQALETIGAELGSDVNFFLSGGTAAAFGRGEILETLPDLDTLRGLLLAPGFPVSTPEAYRALGRGEKDAAAEPEARDRFAKFLRRLEAEPLAGWAAECTNDFEAAVFARHPALAEMRAALERSGARLARMSGSGSSLFALYDGTPPEFPGAIPFRTVPRWKTNSA